MSALLDELIQMENRAEDLRKEIIDKISTSIETVPLDGVTVLNSAPRTVSVNLGAVIRYKRKQANTRRQYVPYF